MTKELDNVLDELNFVPDSDNYFVNQAIQFRELMMMYNCAIREVRTKLWGYAPHEQLSMQDLARAAYQGIRPAVGYPSLPQLKLIFPVSKLLNFDTLNMRLTENGAMYPQSSICGLYLSSPHAKYFAVQS